GYHWFSDWGRDTMIALPGLTLVTGRFEIAKSILLAFAKSVSQGMLPNRFPDEGEDPEYNTVDATLWFFEAIRSLLHYTKDALFVKEHLYAVLKEIIDWHVNGTRYGIKVDEDGLLNSGAPGVQLTWMDARIGDWVVTPRYGKAVEIQALWYNALCAMRDLANRFGEIDRAKQYEDIATKASNSFNNLFWNEAAGCLYDAVNGPENDGSIRPNQILAVSLFHSMLSHERAKRVTEVVERELLTPVGLRSLAKNDPKYAARYEGDMTSRDSVYHQGTVWAWLMGPFITAYLKVNDRSDQALSRIKSLLAGFNEHLNEAMIGHISEIFDGDAPHQPRGCAAQAWSVSEILRAIVENVYEVNPLLKKTSVAKQ
ncbi:MAG TPA: amylo-alpha-1,6-glucosidase, partial [Blastocatellia bacterium]|nr:amylo-alpha-1,6-glucosidase [Blastocatellia bacterium]